MIEESEDSYDPNDDTEDPPNDDSDAPPNDTVNIPQDNTNVQLDQGTKRTYEAHRCLAITHEVFANQNKRTKGAILGRLRLDRTVPHWPVNTKKKGTSCQLHKYLDRSTRSRVANCEVCKVHLCITCFKIFHTAGQDILVDPGKYQKELDNAFN